MWSLLSTLGVTSPPRASCVTHLCPWKPQGLSSSCPPGVPGFGGSWQKGPCLQPSIRIRIMDRRHRSAPQPTPRILCSPPSLFSSPYVLRAQIWALLCHFPSSGSLGNKAWLLSWPRPTLPGEVRMELPHSHQPQPSQSVESRFLLGQASSVKSPGWKPQSTQPSTASSGKLPPATPAPSRALLRALCQRPVEGGLGFVPPQMWLAFPGGHQTGMAYSHGHSGLSPYRQCPATLVSAPPARSKALHRALLDVNIIFPPTPISQIPTKSCDLGSFQHAVGSSLITLSLYRNTANTFSITSKHHEGTRRRNVPPPAPPLHHHPRGGHVASKGQILAQNPLPENPSFLTPLSL